MKLEKLRFVFFVLVLATVFSTTSAFAISSEDITEIKEEKIILNDNIMQIGDTNYREFKYSTPDAQSM